MAVFQSYFTCRFDKIYPGDTSNYPVMLILLTIPWGNNVIDKIFYINHSEIAS